MIRRGLRVIDQAIRMYRFHQTSFEDLLFQMFETLNKYDSRFTFPLTASTGEAHPYLVDLMKSSGNEIAIHGYKHLRYEFLSRNKQAEDMLRAIKAFNSLKIPYTGFRVPYNRYTKATEELIEKSGFEWDGGIGYQMKYRFGHEFFTIKLKNGKKASFTCIPLNGMSDDYLIDDLGFSPKQVAKALISEIKKAKSIHGLVMFDLHPIRIAQKNYVKSLEVVLNFCRKNDIWVPNVSEAISYRKKHNRWKENASACCLLTGDIDNFTFWDYLRRL
jgi:peptidoglycan/xylan/chitin deacetylase (PgdA/CDA1 family)